MTFSLSAATSFADPSVPVVTQSTPFTAAAPEPDAAAPNKNIDDIVSAVRSKFGQGRPGAEVSKGAVTLTQPAPIQLTPGVSALSFQPTTPGAAASKTLHQRQDHSDDQQDHSDDQPVGPRAAAESAESAAVDDRFCNQEDGTISATWENDIFAGTDSDYTNGVRVGYVTPCNNHFAPDRLARQVADGFYPAHTRWYGSYAFGQNIYTPEDITDPDPGPDARPYAGFLYGSFGLIADTRAENDEMFDTLDSFVIDLGVVGNASNAEHAQRIVHEIIDDRKPVGWNDQIEDEPGVRVLFERKWRYQVQDAAPTIPLEADILPHIGAAVGNVDTSAAVGGIFRIGRELDDDYGPQRVRPGLAGPGFFDADDGLGWYVFAGGELRVVGRDIFLDGNTFKESNRVESNPFYSDVQAGTAVQIGSTELAFTYVVRAPQYEAQNGWAQFGSVNVRSRF